MWESNRSEAIERSIFHIQFSIRQPWKLAYTGTCTHTASVQIYILDWRILKYYKWKWALPCFLLLFAFFLVTYSTTCHPTFDHLAFQRFPRHHTPAQALSTFLPLCILLQSDFPVSYQYFLLVHWLEQLRQIMMVRRSLLSRMVPMPGSTFELDLALESPHNTAKTSASLRK